MELRVDGLEIYFSSNRLPDAGAKHDIYVARRTRIDRAFNAPKRVDELSTADFDDAPTWLSPDRCRLYLHSDRSGSFDLYVAEKPAK